MNYLDMFNQAPAFDLHTAMMFAAMVQRSTVQGRSGVKPKPREQAWREYRATGKRYK